MNEGERSAVTGLLAEMFVAACGPLLRTILKDMGALEAAGGYGNRPFGVRVQGGGLVTPQERYLTLKERLEHRYPAAFLALAGSLADPGEEKIGEWIAGLLDGEGGETLIKRTGISISERREFQLWLAWTIEAAGIPLRKII